MPHPTDLILHKTSRVLEVAFEDGTRWRLPAEYLRVESPSAEVQGHGPGQKVLVAGKREVGIDAIEPVGHYGVLLRFSDGHASGIFTWDRLYTMGREQETAWSRYLDALAQAGLSRDP
ncbi:gamma-butyrobetaine hydroxylase-like domain-containing protein [Coralloluteibacterium thermophilus]|uniref:Gamma-butyrobetaine hydroxylase-like domain-containing protein n=1 Tax=Coralloluteibacterium thermophilum TaxID=2707049 RepID=A0ABV9NMQ7_9GAMM